ncbi:hypothetical protein LUZ63_013331 [Rhynchospora breviuscula]|uniref:Uncharacterized protein n=1 Tax=Rhynchospora breviuscula TaxID=2022672 RepID=A0A9Q0C8C9_9POAL|nr:hypothetical protein LUZ63_013331 [Rhynchospora breviuscula]
MNRTTITTTTTRSEKANSLSSFMTSPSPSSSLPSSLPPLSPFFSPSPIPEHEEKKSNDKNHNGLTDNGPHQHQPTPLHPSTKKKRTPKQTPLVALSCDETTTTTTTTVAAVSCSKCRPSSRDVKRPSVVPISPTSTSASRRITPPSPLSLLNSLFHRRTNGSISSNTTPKSSVASACDDSDPQYWRATATELSKKLIAATRKRDEALLETSKLKYSLSELELKLANLESSYHDLTQPNRTGPAGLTPFKKNPDPFVQSVADSRAASRLLARALSSHLRKSPVHNSSGLLPAHTEAFLNRVFYSGFELDSEEEIRLADPAERCELNRSAYESIRDLTWDEVLTKGTKHFSEGLSRFCDSKMSDVVGSIGWTKSWPEPLLQAFFLAAKAAWSVRLLARSVHPSVPIIRVDRGAKFDSRFMEDTASDRAGTNRLEPVSVKMLVAPGFHVYTSRDMSVVKCKVLCLYNSRRDGYRDASVGDGVGQCQLRDKV